MTTIQPPVVEDHDFIEEIEKDLATGNYRRIETFEDAVRYAYGLSETKKELEQIDDILGKEVARWQSKIDAVKEWAAQQTLPREDKIRYMEHLLKQYHEEEYFNAPNDKARKKVTSIKLPYGVTLKSVNPQTGYEIADEEAYKQYMQDNGFAEAQEPKLKWGDFKKTVSVTDEGVPVTADGEVIDFLRVVQPERKFEVK